MFNIYFYIPAIFIIFSLLFVFKLVKKGFNSKKVLISQIASFCFMIVACVIFAFSANAQQNSVNNDGATISNSAYQTNQTDSKAIAYGIGLFAAALVTGLSGIGGGLAVASAAPAAIAATSEDPKAFGKALIFVALGEGIALYGLLVSIMIFNKLDPLIM